MNDYFYSLHFLITGRNKNDPQSLGVMDCLAWQIEDEERPLMDGMKFLFKIDEK